ncbi:MAG: hypothetical protein COV48_05985 [Elusimicrobia bacterium CG11_big_fil_rev_8_21_14_0_20_64_6]|nr:MAG: hypothetical protein COV48_05985 [Elusimicrobia bacterium CG11_big_fil_rev_8_21_14_0_20_64_6]
MRPFIATSIFARWIGVSIEVKAASNLSSSARIDLRAAAILSKVAVSSFSDALSSTWSESLRIDADISA